MDVEKIKKIIECCHLNFLIGSGASRPFLGTLGAIEQLLTSIVTDETIVEDDKIVIEASIKKYYFDIAIAGNLDLNTSSTKLDATKSNYDNFYHNINTLMLKRQTKLISRQTNIFTTNMDLFNEYALEKGNYIYNDGFSGRLNPLFGTENFNNSIRKTSLHFEYQSEMPLFNIFKLHGSVNWKLSADDHINYDNDLKILTEIRTVTINNDSLLQIEYEKKGVTGSEWKTYNLEELKEQLIDRKIKRGKEHGDFLKAYDSLVMINPTKDKFETTTKKLNFYELLRIYSNTLEKENSVLFVFGFSFADEHIREITLRVARANPTLMIIIYAFDNAARAEMEKILPSRSNIQIISDDSDKVKYSLNIINSQYFKEILNSLTD